MDFQDKMGANLDTAHFYYKERWASEIRKILGRRPDLEGILASQDPDIVQKREQLKTRFGLEIETMKRIQDNLGPFDWRLPESQAIYWAWVGLENAHQGQRNFLRRIIWQSMALAFERGRIIENESAQKLEYAPNLGLAPYTHAMFLKVREEEEIPITTPPSTGRIPSSSKMPPIIFIFTIRWKPRGFGLQSLRSAFQTHCPQA